MPWDNCHCLLYTSRILNLNKRFPEIFSLQLDPLKEEMGSIVVPPNPFGMANDSMEMGELTILKKCPAREGEPETMVVVDSRALSQDGPTEFEALCAGTYEIRYWKQSLTGFPGCLLYTSPAATGTGMDDSASTDEGSRSEEPG